MYRLFTAIKKEFLILLNDKAGLALMFVMPLLMVYIITIIQDSAFKAVNENKITLLVVNQDQGKEGDKLVKMLEESHFFTLTENSTLDSTDLITEMQNTDALTGLYIPSSFSEKITQKATVITGVMLEELGVQDSKQEAISLQLPSLKFYHDPVLQENYFSSIINLVDAYIKRIEGDLLITQFCEILELKEAPHKLKEAMVENQVHIEKKIATLSTNQIIPNSTQHNVPAWTIFAMFFMVISLGNNIVKERLNGSFIRLKTMPTSFFLVLGAKLLVYLFAVILQVSVIFSMAKFTFPSIGLPELIFPSNLLATFVVVLVSGLAAISFAMAVGIMAKTQEQANGFGAVSIVILAAIGGIWVPSFVMPDYLKTMSYVSPLYWCLESFYTLFLREGKWIILLPKLISLVVFSLVCFGVSFFKLKKDKII